MQVKKISRKSENAALPRSSWLIESHALFRNWEAGKSWRWQAWLALWPSDPKNRKKKSNEFKCATHLLCH